MTIYEKVLNRSDRHVHRVLHCRPPFGYLRPKAKLTQVESFAWKELSAGKTYEQIAKSLTQHIGGTFNISNVNNALIRARRKGKRL